MAKQKDVPATKAEEPPVRADGKPCKCPISRADFLKAATPLEVVINSMPMGAEVKEFSTGSLGWNINGKMTVKVGGQALSCQVGLNLTVVDSKHLPR